MAVRIADQTFPETPQATGRASLRHAHRLRTLARRLTPAQSLVLGFGIITLAGAVLLALPASSATGSGTSLVDALFTSASAVSTTGLVVVDTGSHFSSLGQAIVLLLIQVGGLGYMVFFAALAYVAGHRVSLSTRMRLADSLVGARPNELRRFTAAVVLFTIGFELLGTVALAAVWWSELPPLRAAYLGLFHSISAFCTAGFGLFADSFTSWRDDPLVNSTVAVVTFAGGIGFFVLREVTGRLAARFRGRRPPPMSMHTRLALGFSAALMAGGAAALWAVDPLLRGLSPRSGFYAATFQAFSAATTTGFNTVDIAALSPAGQLVLVVLMFVGASPGGTGGGVKTTVLALLLVAASASIRGREEMLVRGQRIPLHVIVRGLAVAMLGASVVVLGTMMLCLTEQGSFLPLLFEATSAFGTVGLSTGVTPHLSILGRLIISGVMFVGRVGPLAVGFALLGRQNPHPVRHPVGRLWVG